MLPLPANVNLTQLLTASPAAPPVGSEPIESVQNGVSVAFTVAQLTNASLLVTPRQFGAKGDGTTDDSAAFAAAIAAAVAQSAALGQLGGLVWVTAGNYVARTGVNVPDYVRLVGSSQNACYLNDGGANLAPVVTLSGFRAHLENLTIQGCGRANTADPFPAHPAILIPSLGQDAPVITHCTVLFGLTCIQVLAQDVLLDNCSIASSYSSAVIEVGNNGQLWMQRCTLDQQWPKSLPAGGGAFPGAWAANTTYSAGAVVITAGTTLLQCMSVTGDAKSGSVAPTSTALYGTNITDNHVTWQSVCYNTNYSAVVIDSNVVSENYFHMCDFSGSYINSIWANSAGAIVGLVNCVLSQAVSASIKASAGTNVNIGNCEIFAGWAGGFGVWLAAGYAGGASIYGCYINGNVSGYGVFLDNTTMIGASVVGNTFTSGTYGVATSANVNSFIVADNIFNSNITTHSVIVTTGTSNHYNIVNNLIGGISVSDGGSGVNKTISGNN